MANAEDPAGPMLVTGWGDAFGSRARQVIPHAVEAVGVDPRTAVCGARVFDVDRDRPWLNVDFACHRCRAAVAQ